MFYLLKALKNLIEGKSIYSSIAVVTSIVETFGQPTGNDQQVGLSPVEALERLEE